MSSNPNTLKLSKSHVERGLAANPQFRKYEDKLRQMDKNQDGEIDIAELCQVLDEMSTIEKHRKLLKGACCVMAVFSLLTIASIVGLTFAVVDLTKDSNVSSSGILVTKDSLANPIATGQAISLDDASQLFTKNLKDLSDLSFLIIPNESGGTVVHVAEVELVTNTSAKVTTTAGSVYEIDASGIHQINAATGRKLLQTGGGSSGSWSR